MLGFILLIDLSLLAFTHTREIASDAALPVSALEGIREYLQYKFGTTFGKEENECIKQGNSNGRCSWVYSIGYQGPCADGEWLKYNKKRVLHGDGVIVQGCYPKPCPAKYEYLIPNRKCYHNDDIKQGICPEGLYPHYSNAFGETYCSCGYRSATLFQSKIKKCYALYTQGPCKTGSMFVPRNDLVNFGYGECVVSHCAKFLNGNTKIAEIRLPSGQTDCFELQTHGPCKNNYYLDVVDRSIFPGVSHLSCDVGLVDSAVIVTSKHKECVENDKGECVKPLEYEPVDPHPSYLD